MADLLALVCVYCDFVSFPFGILGQVWYLIVSIPDPYCLSYFEVSAKVHLNMNIKNNGFDKFYNVNTVNYVLYYVIYQVSSYWPSYRFS